MSRKTKYEETGDTPGKPQLKTRRIMGYSREELESLSMERQIELMEKQLKKDKLNKLKKLKQSLFGMEWNDNDWPSDSSSHNNNKRMQKKWKSKSKSKLNWRESEKETESEESDSNTMESNGFEMDMNENSNDNKIKTKKKHIASKASVRSEKCVSNTSNKIEIRVSEKLIEIKDMEKFRGIENQSDFNNEWNIAFELKKSGWIRFCTAKTKIDLPVEIRFERLKPDPTADDRRIIIIKGTKTVSCKADDFVAAFETNIENGDTMLKNFVLQESMCKDLFFFCFLHCLAVLCILLQVILCFCFVCFHYSRFRSRFKSIFS